LGYQSGGSISIGEGDAYAGRRQGEQGSSEGVREAQVLGEGGVFHDADEGEEGWYGSHEEEEEEERRVAAQEEAIALAAAAAEEASLSAVISDGRASAKVRLDQRAAEMKRQKEAILSGKQALVGGGRDSAGPGSVLSPHTPHTPHTPGAAAAAAAEGGGSPVLGTIVVASLEKPFGIRFFQGGGKRLIVDDVQGAEALRCGVYRGDILEDIDGRDVRREKPSRLLKELQAVSETVVVRMRFRRPGIGGIGGEGQSGTEQHLIGGYASPAAGMDWMSPPHCLPHCLPSPLSRGRREHRVPYPRHFGWLEKKGTVFWNMRYFVLADNGLAYYDCEQEPDLEPIIPGGDKGPGTKPRGVVPLEGCDFSLRGGVLCIGVRKGEPGGFLERARHGNAMTGSIRLWHRDGPALEAWYHTLKKSTEIHQQRLLFNQARRDLPGGTPPK